MPYQVLFTEDAERDLEDRYRFLAARDGIQTAERILGEIEGACLGLEDLPTRGNVPKELTGLGITDYRELHHKPWRVVYRIIGEDVILYCIADGRRDMQSFLERRLLR
ncbi:type II toxin-antitoxin system RelE/ParE family toxin (plasmid) [Agrobacterium tumefaciens]|uniref:type II toxin-antitoxin system RelE/ParE family toxin n=1 Tax=Agrobacterium tumefaciens TaxID=358 RepID=UPI000E0B98A1|nr:type II toxin-antitoxin system RelE/ParE family toxin [Agrobacterium tumefaciens]WQE43479.1 type II toxin-antitoxin system RelE/ParE family toxin [Agrobacterium tumefaciens]